MSKRLYKLGKAAKTILGVYSLKSILEVDSSNETFETHLDKLNFYVKKGEIFIDQIPETTLCIRHKELENGIENFELDDILDKKKTDVDLTKKPSKKEEE